MATPYPLTQVIEVSQPKIIVNVFDEEELIEGDFKPVAVFGWAVTSSQEKEDDSVLRTIDLLQVYMRPEDVTGPAATFRLPDGSEWEQEGNVADYNHNPWFQPGLVVVNAKKVEG